MLNFFKVKDGDRILLELGNAGDFSKSGDLELLSANSTDAATEKHVPVVTIEDGLVVVRVGSVPHPMTPEHYIEWVFVKTSAGGTYCNLTPEDVPEAKFPIAPDEVEAVYIYCNLHGLWKAQEPVFPNFFDSNDIACSAEFSAGCVDPLSE